MSVSEDYTEEFLSLLCCEHVLEVLHTLESWVNTASTSRKLGMHGITCWWFTHSQNMTAATFYQRYRVWPSALYRVICLHKGLAGTALTDQIWSSILRMDCTRNVCHALEYMVHGT